MNLAFRKVDGTIEYQHLDGSYMMGNAYISPIVFAKQLDSGGVIGMRLHKEALKHSNPPRWQMAFFLRWQQMQFTQHFYVIAKQLRQGQVEKILKKKIKFYHRLLPVKRTSQNFTSAIIDLDTNQPLVHTVGCLICVNLETRHAAVLPDEIRKHFSSHSVEEVITPDETIPDRCTKLYGIPEKANIFNQFVLICAHHVDINDHVSQSSYVELCFNCVSIAIMGNNFPKMRSPIWDYPVKRLSLLYARESTIGDTVEVIVWENQSVDFEFHFHVKRDQVVLCQAEFQFFPPISEPFGSRL